MGSPPQVRGKPAPRSHVPSVSGITPAGAGKTDGENRCLKTKRDHPRRCGENALEDSSEAHCLGSPPQVRGKQVLTEGEWWDYRITPAGAGKTQRLVRMCRACPGSPPQVRGKLRALTASPPERRITPAGAGKTAEVVDLAHYLEDHPRRCGENSVTALPLSVFRGSPPQVRGKHVIAGDIIDRTGITPAGAGKTVRLFRARDIARDHPRRCGENSAPRSHVPSVSGITPAGAGKTLPLPACRPCFPGSPPQVRGKHDKALRIKVTIRITPAGAGKTCVAVSQCRCHVGSPPQVRGKLCVTLVVLDLRRITPAGAGKTPVLQR